MPYREILTTARTFDDLKRIAAARRYADGWVYRTAKELGIAIPRREQGALLRPPPIPTHGSSDRTCPDRAEAMMGGGRRP
jgi:hypothetical protein